jgi:malate dehydrogenase (oxaloacetate-decarboxylating)(NADP+)
MKIAATHALAELAKQDVPDEVLMAYKTKSLSFGANYIIPKPFDARVLYKVAPAVARAAMESGVALKPIADFRAYEEELERRLHPSREMVQWFINQARHDQKMRIVFPEGGHEKILRACRLIIAEGIARPILLGEPDKITERIVALGLDLPEDSYEIIDIEQDTKQLLSYAAEYAKLRSRKGVTIDRARQLLKRRINFGMMMVKMGDADGCVAGVSRSFPDTVRPALQIVGLDANANRACAMHMMLDKKGAFRFFSDTALNVDPNAQDLADITIATTDLLQQLGITPRVAMLSFSNFGSVNNPETQKSAEAVRLVKKLRPNLMIDGEMRVSLATDPQKYFEDYPFCELTSPANVFIFPCLNSGNIGHQLLHYLGGMEVVGPILIGIDKPINALPRDCSLDTIVSVTAITSVMAKRKQALNNK